MSLGKPSLPQGTRDFGPETVRKRNYILATIKQVFEVYGFLPLETPAMENLETLLGKYGEEGDKLIFKILNNGLHDPKHIESSRAAFEHILAGRNDKQITERALRYDLTIPLARYVAMNHGGLVYPFRRYQVQPVWRADKPQRGRYREFLQCDADVVGSKSLVNEAELALIYATVFDRLKIDVEIKLNHRLILTALAETCHAGENMMDITVAIDKLDKVGMEKVREELSHKGLDPGQIALIDRFLAISGTNEEKIKTAREFFGDNPAGNKGLDDLEKLLAILQQPHQNNPFQADFTLARGLNYYTGIIFEVKAKDVRIGSIGGGGRYDDLTGLFGVPGIPGVGISFGIDRIYDVMEELGLFPASSTAGTRVLFFNLGEAESQRSFSLMQELRSVGVPCELYHEKSKMDKQFKYAEKRKIPYIVIIGDRELHAQTCNIKDLRSGSQQTIPQVELPAFPFTDRD